MRIESIAQPTHRSTLAALDGVLQTPNLQIMEVAAAYITSGGADDLLTTLNARLGPHNGSVQKRWITSFDYCRTEPVALDALLSLPSSQVRIFDPESCLAHQGTPRIPFHPKAFLFRSVQFDCVLAGSGNVSRSGLSRGVEAGLVLTIDRLSATVEPTARASISSLQGWFGATWAGATLLDAPLLARYQALYERAANLKNPIPTEDDILAGHTGTGALSETDLRKLRVCRNLWIETGNITKNRGAALPGNQLMMKRLSRVFFGFDARTLPENSHVGDIAISYNGHHEKYYSLTYSDNKMDKLVLPIPGSDGPTAYDNVCLLFRRVGPRRFELSVGSATDRSSWMKRSKLIEGAFKMSSGREWGVF